MPDAATLFGAHRDGVFRYLRRIVGQHEAAEDLTQEVFLRVSRAEIPTDGDVERRAWVFRIARNLALNHLRNAGRRPAVVELTDQAASTGSQEVGVAVRAALLQLTDLDRDVFLMRESGGLSYDEIAMACELTADAVRSRLHRARQELRTALGGAIRAERRRGIRFTSPK